MTLADFQSSSSECALNVVSVSMLEYGTVDFSAALSQAKQAQTRLFAILLDEPVMAGQLLEQGYNLGLFRQGTEILGTEAITTPQTWKAIVNKQNVVNIMKGFIGVRYSPGFGMMSTKAGSMAFTPGSKYYPHNNRGNREVGHEYLIYQFNEALYASTVNGSELAQAKDSEGRIAMNIASHTCQRIIKESTYFCKRYEITTLESPVHLSRTCVVHLALDHRHAGEKVALKLMKNFDQYNREVTVRKEACLSNDFTINILRTHDINADNRYEEEIKRRGLDEYLYCIVMPCADRDLNRIITNEHIAGKDWGQIKSIAIEIAKALQHMHNNGVIHGDVKSKNIMRIGHRVKFIDFDASVRIGKDFVGAKYSSAFVPPEMIFFRERTLRKGPGKAGDASPQQYQDKRVSEWKQYSGRYFEDHDNICVKAYDIDPATGEIMDKDKLPFELNIAHYSYDTWAFGVVLFELCAGISLFLANSEDNILYENMLDLYAFTDKYKKKRMAEIVNIEARNLVAQMLTRNPLKRPQMSQVLAHPFLSGKKATRLFGEVAEFDVFLSYRKQSDENHAQLMYTKLTDAGLKVWWDKKSLMPGDIVMNGGKELYTDYFLTDCHPKCTNHVIVESVENALQDQLNRLCFGTPLIENPT
eukprot:gene69311-biopygen14977